MILRSDHTGSLSVSVIIPTFRRAASLQRCLDSFRMQDHSHEAFEVIVINDGGDPSHVERIRSDLPLGFPLILIHRAHQGVAAARACGIKHSRAGILAFLDDDCTVAPDYISTVIRVFKNEPDTDVFQVALENPEADNIFGTAWKLMFDQTLRANISLSADGRLLSGILGGVMVARKHVFEKVTYGSPDSPSREDADIRCQLHSANIPVYYQPDVRVFHHCRNTLTGYLRQQFWYGRGSYHFNRRWGSIDLPFRYGRIKIKAEIRTNKIDIGPGRVPVLYCLDFLRRAAGRTGWLFEKMRWTFFRPKVRSELPE